MTQYEYQMKAWLEGALGEPVVQFAGVSAAGRAILWSKSGVSPSWRPHLTVNGHPHTRVPHTMGLILTPTRLMITELNNRAPDPNATILNLQRGDAEIIITTRPSLRKWTYSLRSRASGAELEVEVGRSDRQLAIPFAAELAARLSEFSVTPTTPRMADGTPELGYNRRSALKVYRRIFTYFAIGALVVSLGTVSFAAYHAYAYSVGTPTKAEIYSCSGGKSRSCKATWTVSGETYRGTISGDLPDVKAGSSVEVHVFHGTAYASVLEAWSFAAVPFFGIGLLCLYFGTVYKPDV